MNSGMSYKMPEISVSFWNSGIDEDFLTYVWLCLFQPGQKTCGGQNEPLAKYNCFIISPVEEKFIGQKLYKRLSRFVSTLAPPEMD